MRIANRIISRHFADDARLCLHELDAFMSPPVGSDHTFGRMYGMHGKYRVNLVRFVEGVQLCFK